MTSTAVLAAILASGGVLGFIYGIFLFIRGGARDDPSPIEYVEDEEQRYYGGKRWPMEDSDDVEHMGSHLARPPSGAPYAGRPYEHRYDGLADRVGRV